MTKVAGLGRFCGAYIFDRINRIYRIEISWGISSSLEFKFESGIGDFVKVAVEGLTVLCQNFWGRVEGVRMNY